VKAENGVNCLNKKVLACQERLALPIAVYPGLALTGAKVCDVVTRAPVQFETQAALHQRYRTGCVLTAMDLSAEAEAFGCTIHQTQNEIPSVTGRRVTTLTEAENLAVPQPGDRRTAIYLETARRLKTLSNQPLVLGGCIGPFSLAARLVGVSEAMELTLTEPDLMGVVLVKCTQFLQAYTRAFKAAGVDGMIMAEPAAGLLSPRAVARFSSGYVRQIAAPLLDGHFAFILHNCAAKLMHLPAILETGLSTFHFGAPMDMGPALQKVPPSVVLCGNLDPAAVFCHAPADELSRRTADLLSGTAAFRNYVISSGCDVPPGTPLANLDAFYETVRQWNVAQEK
jgi:uroporphyrinogen decarboxylase